MFTLVIDCPRTGNNIVVAPGSGSGSCSSAVGTMCVNGHLLESLIFRLLRLLEAPVRWLRRLFRPKPAAGATFFVRVRVLNGDVSLLHLPPPLPKQCWDVDTPLNGQLWCAQGVLAPAASASGSPLTAVAWLMNSDGTPAPCEPASVQFNGGGSNAIDCCSGCGSGAGMSQAARELGSRASLEVTVPDGLNAGLHLARAVDYLTWEVRLSAATYRLCARQGEELTLRGPSGSAPADRVEWEPFSAVFPGGVFGSAGDVVVTAA